MLYTLVYVLEDGVSEGVPVEGGEVGQGSVRVQPGGLCEFGQHFYHAPRPEAINYLLGS